MDNHRPYPKIVVTGVGSVCSLGNDVNTIWDNMIAGKSGIDRISHFDPENYSCKVASEIKNWDPSPWMDPKEARRNDLFTQYALAASKMAFEDAKIDLESIDKTRFGVIIGSGIGGMGTVEAQASRLEAMGPRKVSPFMVPMLISNMASGVVAIEYGLMGPNFGIVSACATASHAIGDAIRILRLGEADMMLVGGAEAAVTPLSVAGFANMKAMSTNYNDDPTKSSRPFDAKRDGFVMGEGAGILMIETYEHAKARGARIYCELAGHAATCDGYHITSPEPTGKGLKICMERALADAGISKEEVNYVNAHGTSTPYNDKTETIAMKAAFGDYAKKLKISSTKSMTGHLLGAAGGIEAIVCVKAIEQNKIPPTINYENEDPECDLNYVPNVAIDAEVNVSMSNNLGFGGHNASIVFKKFKD